MIRTDLEYSMLIIVQIRGIKKLADRGNGKDGSAATTILSIRVIVEMAIEAASSSVCLSW